MATLITKNSQTASAVPSAASLQVGELAVNTADGKLYTEHTGGVVKEIIPSTVVDGGITEAKIASNAVTTAKIADGSITTAKIATGAVITEDLADNAVTTAKINNASVTIAKLSATGTPGSGNFLRGDGSWQAAGASTTYADIGTYIMAGVFAGANATLSPGNTYAGSSIRMHNSVPFSGIQTNDGSSIFNPSLGGTWRVMTRSVNTPDYGGFYYTYPTILVRIS